MESDNLRRQNDISRIERQRRVEENKKVDLINAACTAALDLLVEEVVSDVCLLGSREHAHRIQKWMELNFDLIFDLIFDALIKVNDLVVDELVTESLISASIEHFERVTKLEAMKLIAQVVNRHWRRKRLLNKWRSFISEELPFDKGISKIARAARLIVKASPVISRLKLPVSQLVGRNEIDLLEKYAPSLSKIHNATAMNESISRRIVIAETAVASALGSALRESFLDHAAYSRRLHIAKCSHLMFQM